MTEISPLISIRFLIVLRTESLQFVIKTYLEMKKQKNKKRERELIFPVFKAIKDLFHGFVGEKKSLLLKLPRLFYNRMNTK